jgi:hypothetical protein
MPARGFSGLCGPTSHRTSSRPGAGRDLADAAVPLWAGLNDRRQADFARAGAPVRLPLRGRRGRPWIRRRREGMILFLFPAARGGSG